MLFLFYARPKFAKRNQWSKRRIPPQTPPPPLATSEFKKISRVFCEILSPKNSFRKTSSVLKPHALPEYLESRTPERKTPFPFSRKNSPPPNQKCKECFSFGVTGVLASAWGFGSFVQFSLEKVRAKCIITAQ